MHTSCSSCSICTAQLSLTFERLAVSAAKEPARALRQRNNSSSEASILFRRNNNRRQAPPSSSLLRPSKLAAAAKKPLSFSGALPVTEGALAATVKLAASGVKDEMSCEKKETAVTAGTVAIFGGNFSAAFDNFAALSLGDGSGCGVSKVGPATGEKFVAGTSYRSPSVGIFLLPTSVYNGFGVVYGYRTCTIFFYSDPHLFSDSDPAKTFGYFWIWICILQYWYRIIKTV
jgi:hypothetical protein